MIPSSCTVGMKLSTHKILYFCCSLLSLVGRGSEAKFYSKSIAQEHLLTDLFANYNPLSKPKVAKGERIDVQVNITLQHFQFRENDGAFHMTGILDMTWHDLKLVWNPRDYNNLTRVPVNQRALWVPDLEVYNNAPDKFLRMHRNGIVMLNCTGALRWSDTIEMVIFCTTDMHNWPHDRHMCKLSLGSWTYDGFQLDITNADPNTTMHFNNDADTLNALFRVNAFRAEHVSTYYNCCPEPYINIDYHIEFERRAAFVVLFRVMAFAVIALSLLALSLEPSRGDKILLNGIAMFLVVFNLIYFAGKVGQFARGTPLIVTFYSYCFVLVTLAQLVATFSLLATRSPLRRGELPHCLYKLLHLPLIGILAPHKARRHFEVDTNEEKLFENASFADDWRLLAIVVERIALILASSGYVLLATICFV